jgi:hypothetical protein
VRACLLPCVCFCLPLRRFGCSLVAFTSSIDLVESVVILLFLPFLPVGLFFFPCLVVDIL